MRPADPFILFIIRMTHKMLATDTAGNPPGKRISIYSPICLPHTLSPLLKNTPLRIPIKNPLMAVLYIILRQLSQVLFLFLGDRVRHICFLQQHIPDHFFIAEKVQDLNPTHVFSISAYYASLSEHFL